MARFGWWRHRVGLGFGVAILAGAILVSSSPAQDLPLGIVAEKPASGRFVETPQGYMVPYTTTIPGTTVEFHMEPIPGGTFRLGSPDGEAGRRDDEGPQVTIEVAPMWVGRHEVTWSEYQRYMEMHDAFKAMVSKKVRPPADQDAPDVVTAPSNLYDATFTYSKGKEPKQPAISMSQFAAKQYTKWLSKISGQIYRLPTESEWEYAARAGTTTRYYFGDDEKLLEEHAWFAANGDEKLHVVGQKKPNPWGLYDVHGNVAEWTLDQFEPSQYEKQKSLGKSPLQPLDVVRWPDKLYPRVVRGGSWDDSPENCRSAARKGSHDDDWREKDPNFPQSPWWFTSSYGLGVGFRLVRPLETPSPELLKRYWDPDIDQVRDDANFRINEEGRGARAIADGQLVEDVRKAKGKR